MYRLYLFFILLLLCSHYFVIVVSILLKIIFGHTQISASKIGMPMSKTTCINYWLLLLNGAGTCFQMKIKKP